VGNKTARECVQFYYLWKRLCPDEYNCIRSGWKEKEKMGDDMNNNVQEDSHSKKSSVPWHQQSSGCKSLMDQKGHSVDDFQTVVYSLGEGIGVRVNMHNNSGTSVRSLSSPMSSNTNSCQNVKTAYSGHEKETKDIKNSLTKIEIESTLLSSCAPNITVKPKTSAKQQIVDVSKDIIEDQMAIISNNFVTDRGAEANSKTTILNDVKSEPWEYCVKQEVKEELENTTTDFSETKVYISEFDVVKLNHVSNTPKDDNETVEEAPIIVNRSSHLNDDTDDQVKMEIESMMALHGIRMEDDVSNEAINSETGDIQTIFKEEPQDCDQMKDTCLSPPTALTEEHVSTSSESRLFVCELADCSASFNSRAALNGHIRIHGYRKSPPPNMNAASQRLQRQEYHCETCGKTFAKLKSRNAHMKTHKLSSADLAETLAGRATGISSSGDLSSNSKGCSTGLTFSTCLNFGLSQSESEVPKEITLEEDPESKDDTATERTTPCPQQESTRDSSTSKGSSEPKKRTGSKKVPGYRPTSDCNRTLSGPNIFRPNNLLGGKPTLTVSCTSSVPTPNPFNENATQLSAQSDSKSSPTTTVTLPDASFSATDDLPSKSFSIHQHKLSNKAVPSEPQKAFLKKLKAKTKQSPSAFCSLGRVK
ncbi:hypothetical protein FOCC_FOCC005973, partial [Frankliniella occidentalis]